MKWFVFLLMVLPSLCMAQECSCVVGNNCFCQTSCKCDVPQLVSFCSVEIPKQSKLLHVELPKVLVSASMFDATPDTVIGPEFVSQQEFGAVPPQNNQNPNVERPPPLNPAPNYPPNFPVPNPSPQPPQPLKQPAQVPQQSPQKQVQVPQQVPHCATCAAGVSCGQMQYGYNYGGGGFVGKLRPRNWIGKLRPRNWFGGRGGRGGC